MDVQPSRALFDSKATTENTDRHSSDEDDDADCIEDSATLSLITALPTNSANADISNGNQPSTSTIKAGSQVVNNGEDDDDDDDDDIILVKEVKHATQHSNSKRRALSQSDTFMQAAKQQRIEQLCDLEGALKNSIKGFFHDNTDKIPASIMIRGFQESTISNNHVHQLNGIYKYHSMHGGFPAFMCENPQPTGTNYYIYWGVDDERWYVGPVLGSTTEITCFKEYHQINLKFHLPTDFMDLPVVYWNTVQWVMDYNVEFVSLDSQVNVGTRVALDSVSKTEFGVVKALGVMSSGKIWCGVKFDNPVGMCDGVRGSTRWFQCPKNHGAFCRSEDIRAVGKLEDMRKLPSVVALKRSYLKAK